MVLRPARLEVGHYDIGYDLVVAPVLLVGVDVGGVSSLRCTLGV